MTDRGEDPARETAGAAGADPAGAPGAGTLPAAGASTETNGGKTARSPGEIRETARSLLCSGRVPDPGIDPGDARELLLDMHACHTGLEVQRENLRAAGQEAERSRDRFRRLVDMAPVGHVILNRPGQVLEANDEACRVLGAAWPELRNRTLPTCVEPPFRDRCAEHLQQVFRQERASPCELRLPGRDGRTAWLEMHSVLLGAEEDPEGLCLSALVDITERIQAREALLRSERLAAVGLLAGGVAHEFNNLHGGVLGFLDLTLETGALPPRDRERLEYARRTLQRAVRITQDLLDFSRTDSPLRREMDLPELVDETMRVLRHGLEKRGIRPECRLGPAPAVLGNPGQLGQVVTNLVLNAQDALMGRDGPCLTVETGTLDGSAFLRVSDNGQGIRERDLPRIFLPFFTTKGASAALGSPYADLQGTGMGLSVCETVVKNHGGRILVESREAGGSTFTVLLPPRPQLSRAEVLASMGIQGHVEKKPRTEPG